MSGLCGIGERVNGLQFDDDALPDNKVEPSSPTMWPL
jgi:hypothetical protein